MRLAIVVDQGLVPAISYSFWFYGQFFLSSVYLKPKILLSSCLWKTSISLSCFCVRPQISMEYRNMFSTSVLKTCILHYFDVFWFWRIGLRTQMVLFARVFLYLMSSSVPSLLPTSLHSFQSSSEFLDILYFSVFDSLTKRFLSLRTFGTTFSMCCRSFSSVDPQLMASAYYCSK